MIRSSKAASILLFATLLVCSQIVAFDHQLTFHTDAEFDLCLSVGCHEVQQISAIIEWPLVITDIAATVLPIASVAVYSTYYFFRSRAPPIT